MKRPIPCCLLLASFIAAAAFFTFSPPVSALSPSHSLSAIQAEYSEGDDALINESSDPYLSFAEAAADPGSSSDEEGSSSSSSSSSSSGSASPSSPAEGGASSDTSSPSSSPPSSPQPGPSAGTRKRPPSDAAARYLAAAEGSGGSPKRRRVETRGMPPSGLVKARSQDAEDRDEQTRRQALGLNVTRTPGKADRVRNLLGSKVEEGNKKTERQRREEMLKEYMDHPRVQETREHVDRDAERRRRLFSSRPRTP
ncbi:hypothetical protein, conserved [Eimeria acervulina]|uniref:Transmembrane protein n=1 Tax=Eimeria acervulina TaxID=5801 RepID=U6GCK6_EIMAC|nr:hypothetical protein, conserved [Eimeria acervulina]CDI77033.1 hypothetical protein, conserved [Eimeria acervulina]